VSSQIAAVPAALVLAEAANVTDLVTAPDLPRTAVWVLAAFFALGVVMNAISRSKKERRMAVVALALSALSVAVALRSQSRSADPCLFGCG